MTSWVDKIQQCCMFNQGQIQTLSLAHLKAESWYLDCRKGFCLKEEGALKASLDAFCIAFGLVVDVEQERIGNTYEVDLFQLGNKERKKVIAKRKANGKKAKKKLEAKRAIEKATRNEAKSAKKRKDDQT